MAIDNQGKMEKVRRCLRCRTILPEGVYITCESCDLDVTIDDSVCFNNWCTADVAEKQDFCPDCKEELRKSSKKRENNCYRCGKRLEDGEELSCKECFETSAKEYRCRDCGEICEGSIRDPPTCNCSEDEVSSQPKTWEDIVEELEEGNRPIELDDERRVYLMKTSGYVKIGISTDPERRRNTIQANTPLPVELVNTIQSNHPGGIECAPP